jgi:hypothetical protein
MSSSSLSLTLLIFAGVASAETRRIFFLYQIGNKNPFDLFRSAFKDRIFQHQSLVKGVLNYIT